jgi:hypothetical protein
LAEAGPIRSSPHPAAYVRTGSATHSAQPGAIGTSRLPKATASKAKSFWEKAWHSWHTISFLALTGEEVIKQFACLLELSPVCLVANFEDGIGRQLSTFRCGPGGCVEEIKQRVTHRPDFGQYQFDRISGPLSRSAQSGPAQPLGESLPRAFGGGFDLGQFVRSQPRGCGLGAEAGL